MKPILLLAAALTLAACGSSTEPSGSKGSGGTGSTSFKNNPCSVTGTLSLATAQATRVDCSNGGTTVTVAGSGASYLVVPEFAVDNVNLQLVTYSLASSASASASRAPYRNVFTAQRPEVRPAQLSALGLTARPRTLQQMLDRTLRARARANLKRGTWSAMALRGRQAAGVRAAVSVPAAGSLRKFNILSNWQTNSFSQTTARLVYVGSNVLVYLDTLAPAGFTQAQLTTVGQYFDQTMFPIDTAAFGLPSDIDNNGHVIMLMSQYVNALTSASDCSTQGFIEGFFDEEDLAPNGSNDPASNYGEVFYTIVPDSAGKFSCAHPISDLIQDIPATFLHELQHLISFSQHYVVHNSAPESGWLDEGMSILAEELGSIYYEQKCPYPNPSCRTGRQGQYFPDSAEGFIGSALEDSYFYATLPDTSTVTLHSDADGGFSWRGGDWLLMRWLTDQNGGNDGGFLKKLEQGLQTGVANIENATGQSFPPMFANWGLALYTDSLPGLPRTTAPAADRFVSRNVRFFWSLLHASDPTNFAQAMPIQLFPMTTDTSSSVMNPGATSYYRLDTPANVSTVTMQFSGSGGTPLLSALKPQLAIFRLPPGQ